MLALSACSGLPTNRLVFVGFLPHKEAAVRSEFAAWGKYEKHSVVFFDSLRRLERDLSLLAIYYPDAQVSIGRELTKLHEETLTTSISDALSWIREKEVLKGEVTVMVYLDHVSQTPDLAGLREEVLALAKQRFGEGARLKDLLREFKDRGIARAELYDLLLEAKKPPL
jgi:16S rRNA (cytidine1402-2'-O)-methyltransferase